MILLGSMTLLAIGLLLLLWQAIVISYHLIRLAVLLIAWCGCALALVVTGCAWLGVNLVQYVKGPRSEEPEPAIAIDILGDDDASIIELQPHTGSRRLRG
jgi:hypothetical protein